MSTRIGSLAPEWRWLWEEVRPFWVYQAANLACIVLLTMLMTGVPLLMKWVIDDIVPRKRWDALAGATALIVAVHVARVLLNAASAMVGGVGVQRVVFRLRSRLVEHVQRLPAAFHAQRAVGDLMQRLERDVAVVGELGSEMVPDLLRIGVKTIATAIAILLLDWRLACVIAPLLPVFAYLRRRYRGHLRRSAEAAREAASGQSSLLNELLAGAVQIQLLGAEPRFLRRFTRLNLVTMRRLLTQRRHEQVFAGLEMSAIGLGIALVIAYGGARVMSGTLTAGGFVAFYAYVGQIFAPMEAAVELYARLQRVRAHIRRLMALDQQPVTIRDAVHARILPDRPRVLAYRDVGFQYAPDRTTLRHVRFEVETSERVAIVGASGSGKSSLLQLIPRLYDVTEGRLEADGHDLRDLSVRAWRRAVSFVPQTPILFKGTVRENMRLGSPGATSDGIARAAWIACFTEVVERMPAGWETALGPLGAGLSGGERQRLAIARALLQQRPVLVLDEATSALDLSTEQRLFSRVADACTGRIVIVVSHRPASIEWANRIVVLEQGRIVSDRAVSPSTPAR